MYIYYLRFKFSLKTIYIVRGVRFLENLLSPQRFKTINYHYHIIIIIIFQVRRWIPFGPSFAAFIRRYTINCITFFFFFRNRFKSRGVQRVFRSGLHFISSSRVANNLLRTVPAIYHNTWTAGAELTRGAACENPVRHYYCISLY